MFFNICKHVEVCLKSDTSFLLLSDRHLTPKKNAYGQQKQNVMLLMLSGMLKRPIQHT